MEQEEEKSVGRPKGSLTTRKTKAEVEKFITLSTNKILKEHMSWTEYVKFCKKEGIGHKRANQYWKICWGRVREKFDLERGKHIDKHISHFWSLYDKALANDDINTSRQILNDLVKLMGLAEPDKVDVNNDINIKFRFGGGKEETDES